MSLTCEQLKLSSPLNTEQQEVEGGSPIFQCLAFQYTHTHSSSHRFYLIGGVFPMTGIVAVVGLLCAVLVAHTSSNDN